MTSLQRCFFAFEKFFRGFFRLHLATFDAFHLDKRLTNRLNDINITIPTEIQQKSLGPIMDGKNVIINAETGSGKTLCYLIPIISKLLEPSSSQKSPTSLILVPNMDLGYQIADLFNRLCVPGCFACPVHRDSPLYIDQKYPVIVSTPHSLLKYNIRSLSSIQTVVIDEADLIVANGGKDLWKLLESFRNGGKVREQSRSENDRSSLRQFVFAAATLPHRGENSVFRKIRRWLPDVAHVSSSMVHQCVPSLKSLDVFVDEEEKLPQLLKYLNVLSDELSVSGSSDDGEAGQVDLGLFRRLQQEQLKVLVFVNTITMARDVFAFLTGSEGTLFKVRDKKPEGNVDTSWAQCRDEHEILGDWVESRVPEKKDTFVTKTGSLSRWRGKIGLLHKEMTVFERQDVLKRFRSNDIVVLVSTDLASRGLDILDISHVIQLDYAQNAADVLHRAGRTARAGMQGTIINFVTENDQDLWKAVTSSKKGPGTDGFQEIFSRNRMFSRRIKKKLAKVGLSN